MERSFHGACMSPPAGRGLTWASAPTRACRQALPATAGLGVLRALRPASAPTGGGSEYGARAAPPPDGSARRPPPLEAGLRALNAASPQILESDLFV